MAPNTPSFDPTELCSRKLLEMVNAKTRGSNKEELEAAMAELALRRRQLAQIQTPGDNDIDA